MKLEGSCHCGAVKFTVASQHPVPYQRCYCSICRKCGGGGGYLINISADAATLHVSGQGHLRTYCATVQRDGVGTTSKHARHFCGDCGTHLWASHADWPELLHPVASAIDTPLPKAPAHVHMMLGSAATWVPISAQPQDETFDVYPAKSIAQWHDAHAVSER